ncbi:hypothetical protein GOP47_0015374 [Adiantum capillus-veneris]|uniref:Uncharacterized protein n=1 Tax=Adiantum capillus-veneris TaxID=13818 RepID=A0A9D4UJI6_ADICA|nr:hypothetical protein GOP47_0015374 [Adiantum capillus-veneris]
MVANGRLENSLEAYLGLEGDRLGHMMAAKQGRLGWNTRSQSKPETPRVGGRRKHSPTAPFWKHQVDEGALQSGL